MSTIRALIDDQASRQPAAVYALTPDGKRALTYSDLARSCRRVAAGLARLGVPPGATISVVMGNGLNTIRLLLGAMYGGYAVNPVNLVSQPEQIRYVLEHADAPIVCVAPDWLDRIREQIAGIDRPLQLVLVDPDAGSLPGDELADASPGNPADERAGIAPGEIEPDQLALLMYTSGTTGQPKGVMLSQRNLVANAIAISDEHRLQPADRVLAVLPLYHINAFAVTMLAPLAHGGSLAMPPRFSASGFWQQAIDSGCTWINLVPTMIAYLLEGEAPPAEHLARIRFCRSASAALPPDQHRAFEQRFGIGIIETMGLTETAAPAFSNPIEAERRRIGSVGRASGCSARVVDAQLHEVPDGTTGEIVIQGPQVMLGYYKNPQATAATFTADGWLRTGDLGHRDADGFFFVTGRIKELIIKGGENIAPREIDEALMQHPAVLEAAAVGIPDRHYGQQIAVAVVLRPGAACDEAQLRSFSETRLGRYKTPAAFRFVTDLPRGPSGKVQRLKLAPLFT